MIRFSFIIPFFNEEKYIARCLDSIFNQTFNKTNFEVILIDDGSTDKSREIALNYNVKLLATNVKGFNAGGARNLGIEEAHGEYIILLDADDYLNDNHVLEKLDNQINNEDLVFVKVKKIEGNSAKVLEENSSLSLDEQIYKSNNFCLTLKCFKRELVNDIRYQANCYHEDISFVMELMCKAKSALYFNKIFHVYFRDGSATTDNYSIRKALDFTKQVLEYLYLAQKYKDKIQPLKKRIESEKYDKKISNLCKWALNNDSYSYKQFLE